MEREPYNEVKPLPEICRTCSSPDCWGCDYAGERWEMSAENELRFKRRLKEKAIERYQRQIKEIDRQLLELSCRRSEEDGHDNKSQPYESDF